MLVVEKPLICDRAACWVLLLVLSTQTTAAEPGAEQVEFFESRIRPVLVERCYACHNSADKAEGGLAIDYRGGIADAEIIVPGEPKASRLLAILRHEIDGLEMPEDGPKLDDQKIADFEKWIAMGAIDPRDRPPTADELAKATSWQATLQRRKQWWSFQPIADLRLPAKNHWSDHPIDRFIFAKREEHGLSAAEPAADAVLIRRLYFALIGLPPDADEIQRWQDRFVADRESAIVELADELLGSPHFGERWARHWMDWIRYAESHGSEGDPGIDNAWLYRDYLIRALNADVPYDQLVREHVAGDLLDQPRLNHELGINESMIGPAHWRMVFHGFAPTDALDEKVRFVDDQINAFSKAFLGLTVSCARCHDHKFDAISQADYYALFGILASCRPGRTVIDVPSRQQQSVDELRDLKPRIRAAVAGDWRQCLPALRERLLAPDGAGKDEIKPESLLHPLHLARQAGDQISEVWKRQVDAHRKNRERRAELLSGKITAAWDLSQTDEVQAWFSSGTGLGNRPDPAGEFALLSGGDDALLGIYPSGVYSHSLSTKHAARFTSPDVRLDGQHELWVRAIGGPGSQLRYVVQDYPRSGTVYPVTKLKPQWNWQRYDLAYWDGDSIHIEITTGKDAPLLVDNQDRSWFGIRGAAIVPKGSPPPGPEREFLDPLLTDDSPAVSSIRDVVDRYLEAIDKAIADWGEGKASDPQASLLNACIAAAVLPNKLADLPIANPLIQQYRKLELQIPVPTRVPGLDETRGREQPLLVRGNPKTPGDITPRRFLEAIDPTPYGGVQSGRRQLADDLLREDNPLTRRVIVNRIWHHLFGRGIVATPDNLGRLGAAPTHPELLDFLAVEFRDNGWSLKNLIRLIVTSTTWQQSVNADKSTSDADPANKFLARANVKRLEAEAIRDSMLKVSGRLDEAVSGPPVDGNSSRRSIYVRVIRNSLDPFLRAFDFPEPFSSTGRRDVTNVPAQSLMLMNDQAVAGYADAWAENVLRQEHQSDEQRVNSMFVTAFGRHASSVEIQQAKAFLSQTHADYQQRNSAAAELQTQLEHHRSQIQSIKEPVRTRLLAQIKQQASDAPPGPKPVARWEFETDFSDAVGSLDGSAKDGAHLEDGALVVHSGGHVLTSPLEQTIKEKTLEAWVRLANLEQRGGGVITLQTRDGGVFDSIVFGERDPRQWMAGSNGFARTRPFVGPTESAAIERPVHVAIVYQSDGMIIGYRDGQPYGKPYKSSGPIQYNAGEAIVSFGVRHLPPVGNRMLSGRITKARLYDRALSAAEVEASANALPYVDDAKVLAALSEDARSRVKMHEQEIESAQRKLQSLGPLPPSLDRRTMWADLARAMFTFKEFIYIR